MPPKKSLKSATTSRSAASTESASNKSSTPPSLARENGPPESCRQLRTAAKPAALSDRLSSASSQHSSVSSLEEEVTRCSHGPALPGKLDRRSRSRLGASGLSTSPPLASPRDPAIEDILAAFSGLKVKGNQITGPNDDTDSTPSCEADNDEEASLLIEYQHQTEQIRHLQQQVAQSEQEIDAREQENEELRQGYRRDMARRMQEHGKLQREIQNQRIKHQLYRDTRIQAQQEQRKGPRWEQQERLRRRLAQRQENQRKEQQMQGQQQGPTAI